MCSFRSARADDPSERSVLKQDPLYNTRHSLLPAAARWGQWLQQANLWRRWTSLRDGDDATMQIIASAMGFSGHFAFFGQSPKCELAHTSFRLAPPKSGMETSIWRQEADMARKPDRLSSD